jgi:hypothetical protein
MPEAWQKDRDFRSADWRPHRPRNKGKSERDSAKAADSWADFWFERANRVRHLWPMDEAQSELQAPQTEMHAARLRLERARAASGKVHEELGRLVGGTSAYWDLESHDGDLFTTVSLDQLAQLCAELGVTVRSLFEHHPGNEPTISPEQLIWKTKGHLKLAGLSLAEFEERIGFEIGPALQDSSMAMDWNVDFLRWLCRELALDWRLVLPSKAG